MLNRLFQYQKRRSVLKMLQVGLLGFVLLFGGVLSASADFSGLVTDLSRNPLSGILVQPLDAATGSPLADPLTTGTDGTYVFDNTLPSGNVYVKFTSLDAATNYPVVYYNNKLSLAQADVLANTSGVVTPNINAVMGHWGQIGGTVTNGSGTGIAGIQVYVADSTGNAIPTIAPATTRADGSYTIGAIPPATSAYKVRFNGNAQYVGQWYSNVQTPSAAVPVSVSDSQTTFVNVVLATANITGTVTNSLGAGIPNITVTIYDASLNFYGPFTTQSDGSYQASGLAPGTYGAIFTDPNSVYRKQYYYLQSSRPAPSITVSNTTVSGINAVLLRAPDAPTAVSATGGNGQATVSFTPPAFDGGSAISSYRVTSSPGGFNQTGTASPITVTGLANGTTYTFTVTATNAIGTGAASVASNSVMPVTVPGSPTAVSATAGYSQATVSFTPPASNGGSAITGYQVTSSPGGFTQTGSVSPITVTGLANGTSYTFTVTAINAAGTGAPSAASNAVVPFVPTLGVTVSGTGGGTVTSSPVGISCVNGSSTGCSAPYAPTTTVNLYASPDSNSTFGGWSGACQGVSTCSVGMSVSQAVTATFVAAPNAMIGATGYGTLQAAFTAAAAGATIDARAIVFAESDVFAGTGTVSLVGGWDAPYQSNANETTISGSLKVRNGKLVVRNVLVR